MVVSSVISSFTQIHFYGARSTSAIYFYRCPVTMQRCPMSDQLFYLNWIIQRAIVCVNSVMPLISVLEVYPTYLRAVGLGSVVAFSMLGGAVASFFLAGTHVHTPIICTLLALGVKSDLLFRYPRPPVVIFVSSLLLLGAGIFACLPADPTLLDLACCTLTNNESPTCLRREATLLLLIRHLAQVFWHSFPYFGDVKRQKSASPATHECVAVSSHTPYLRVFKEVKRHVKSNIAPLESRTVSLYLTFTILG
ncbi:hypothetical protein CEXT_94261 [Caerostris extrusa]|uniref:Uncharacterized protein n=1 Tax=Caerostris extrusa TaxID=172846 RepID=A0AAV4VJX1_CAEEX|nr:hypothetical protein CEXT_94261 [Caerostris extrusa]